MAEAVFPTVTCDIRLGEIFDEVHFRPHYIGELMLAGGMTAGEVLQTTVHLSSESGSEPDSKVTTNGFYDRKTKIIQINFGDLADAASLNEGLSSIPKKDSRKIARKFTAGVAETYTETIFHEARHAIDDYTMTPEQHEAEFRAHHRNVYTKRTRMGNALAAVGGLAAFGGMYETFFQSADNPNAVYEYFFPGAIIGLAALIVANRSIFKANNTQHSHADYKIKPWEIRAFDYAAEQLAIAKDAGVSPLRFKLKSLAAFV